MTQPEVHAHDVRKVLSEIGEMEFRTLSAFNEGAVGVFWTGAGTSPWERHPDDDELLHVIDGAVEITVLTNDDEIVTQVGPGELIVVPKGHWHRHHIPDRLLELYLTPGPSEHSTAEDPRVEN